jgi:hypothetical protein
MLYGRPLKNGTIRPGAAAVRSSLQHSHTSLRSRMDTPGSGAPRWSRRVALAVALVLVLAIIFLVCRRLVLGPDHFTIEQTHPVESQVDGMPYRVHGGHDGAQKAADALAALNARIIDLMRYLRNKYVRGPDGQAFPERREAVQRMLKRYNPDNLAENSPKDPSGDTSYTLDKGSVVAICLRDRGSPEHGLHDLDTLTFVTLHEMGHIAIDAVDHPTIFWSSFKFLLEAADEAEIFKCPNYTATPRRYCGVKIDYSPLHDVTLVSI